MFYATSAVCHVACILLLMLAPLGMRMRRPLKEPLIQAEETEDVVSPRFNVPRPRAALVASTARPDEAEAGRGDGSNDDDTYRPVADRPSDDAPPVDIDTLGATRAAEKAITAALDWFVRHQERDGHWSLSDLHQHCQGEPCDQLGAANNDAAATGLALLPFLARAIRRRSRAPIARRSAAACTG